MNGAQVLLETLRAWDVRYVFSCPGTTEVPLLDALVDEADIEFVLTTHESVAVAMADGYARTTGRPGVAYLHTNVGLTNGLAHLYAAQVARSPVVVLTGVKPTATLPHRALTTVPDIRGLARPFCRHDWQTLRPDALGDDLHRALHAATRPPEGPAFLAVPQDMLTAEAGVPARPPGGAPIRQGPDPAGVARAAELLGTARRPVIIAGEEVARRSASPELAVIAERIGAPVFGESRRDLERTAFPTTHPYYAGLFDTSSRVLAECDVLFLAGSPTFLEFGPDRGDLVLPGAALVHLGEDPHEVGHRFATRVALAGDAHLALTALRERIGDRPGPADPAFRDRAVRERRHARPGTGEAIGPHGAAVAIADAVGTGNIVVADAVTTTEPLLDALRRERPGTFFASAGGSLGWGMGAALGVQLANPDDRVVAVVGDGVSQFGLPALWTAVRYGLPVTYVIVNNACYAAVRSGLRRYHGRAHEEGRYPLTDIAGPHLARVAEGFGAHARRVTRRERLPAALRAAIDDPAVSVVEIML